MGSILSSLVSTLGAFVQSGITIAEILGGVVLATGSIALIGWAYVNYTAVNALANSQTAADIGKSVASGLAQAVPGIITGGAIAGPIGAAIGAVTTPNIL